MRFRRARRGMAVATLVAAGATASMTTTADAQPRGASTTSSTSSTSGASAAAPSAAAGRTRRAPIVVFPAFHFTKLRVTVRGQHTAAGCPASGTFQDWFLNPARSRFSQVCRDELLTLRYHEGGGDRLGQGFREQPGVHVGFVDYGSVTSAPFYQPMYDRLAAAGWTLDQDVRVAGYDSRLSPAQGGFLSRTKRLVEDTYRRNGDSRVWLVGHSNGPIYAQYLLTHTSRAWRDRYVAGYTPIAGNVAGQGLLYSVLFTGLNITDFSYPTTPANARSSARMYLSQPSTYLSAANPEVFGRSEVVLVDRSTGRRYTPDDFPALLADAHLPQAEALAQRYIGSVRFLDPLDFPGVDVRAERGSGLPTAVGLSLPGLQVGQLVTPHTKFLLASGDSNQENTTNTAIDVWAQMTAHVFTLTDNPGVGHFDLPSDPHVLNRLVRHARSAG